MCRERKKIKDKSVKTRPSVFGETTRLVQDPVFIRQELERLVEDTVKLLLAAYFEEDNVRYPFGIGTDDNPVKVEVEGTLQGTRVTHFFRRPSGSYYADFKPAFRVAQDVLAVYGRAYLFNFPKAEQYLTDKEMFISLVHWTMLAFEDSWVNELKNRLLVTFSRAEGQPEPCYETPHHRMRVFLGTFGKMAVRDAFRSGKIGRVWRNTVLHGIKKGMPSVSDDFVIKALRDHGKILGKGGDSTEEFCDLVEKVSSIVFRDVRCGDVKLTQNVSQNACWEANKACGGSMSVLTDYFDDHHFLSAYSDLVVMCYDPVQGVTEVRTNKYDSPLKDRSLFMKGPTSWGVEVIREPLKVRCITKGEAWRNAAYSDVQKQLWSALQRFNCFRLTAGSGVRESILSLCPLLGETASAHWCSGDYKAATDSILPEVMEAGIHGIRDTMLANLMKDNLSNGIISYADILGRINKLRAKLAMRELDIDIAMKILEGLVPEDPEQYERFRRYLLVWIDDVNQLRGQLMGSIFSFPILCIINLCTYLATAFRSKYVYGSVDRKTISLKQLENFIVHAPVLVNGDDILFRSPSRRFTEIWEYNAACAGFTLSVGKTYYSSKFAVVNSTYFHVASDQVCPYVNMGIVYGRKKGDNDSRNSPSTLREKMASLPGYFKDLFKHFRREENPLKERLQDFCWSSRQDVKWSKWSKTTLGLGTKGDDLCTYYSDCVRLMGRNRSGRVRNLHDKDLFWKGRKEVDTSILYSKTVKPLSRAPVESQIIAHAIRGHWIQKIQEQYDEWWSTSITPSYSRERM